MSATEETVDEMRAALEAAYEHHADDANTDSAEAVVSSDAADGASANGADADLAPPGDPAPGSGSETADDGAAPDTKDASKAEPKTDPGEKEPKFTLAEPDEATDTATEADAPAAPPATRAPAGWRAGAREHWEKLPTEVQAEVQRREREMGRTMREAAEARQFQSTFEQAIAPYRDLMAANGQDPITTARNLMQVEAGLRSGSAQQKAKIAADIIHTYGVDITTLDGILSGDGPGVADPGNQALLQAIDQRLAPVQRFMSTVETAQTRASERTEQEIATELEQFEADHEFIDDVREDMANILDASARAGQTMTFERAYQTALTLHPDIQGIIAQREAAKAAKTANESLERKKRAASSVTGEQRTQTAERPTDMRGQLEAAIRYHGGE